MGLPLYTAPVESDIPGKSVPKDPRAASRSAIRRARQISLDAARDRRRALAAAAVLNDRRDTRFSAWNDEDNPEGFPRPVTSDQANRPSANNRYITTPDPASDIPVSASHESLRDIVRHSRLPSGSGRIFGTHGGGIGVRYTVWGEDDTPSYIEEELSGPRRRPAPQARSPDDVSGTFATEPAGSAAPVSTRASSGIDQYFLEEYGRLRPRLHRSSSPLPTSRTLQDPWPPVSLASGAELPPISSHSITRNIPSIQRLQEAQFDGLGDRERSLSPDAPNGNAWDTLFSTITPDPQPPSVGSSFASTNASAAASQSAAAEPASTSHRRPSVAAFLAAGPRPRETELMADGPCDSAWESSESEEDEEEHRLRAEHATARTAQQQAARAPLRRLPRSGRSYAAVAAHAISQTSTADELHEVFGDMGGMQMQRIVRHLAERADIPEEWWAGAGLSRTLSRGDAA